MKTFSLCLAALAAVVTLTAVAAAGREAAKQRVAITSKLYPERTFVLTPLKAGDLMRDSGEVSIVHGFSREVMRDAQGVDIYPRSILTFKGKRGTVGQASTPRSPEVGEVAMRGSVTSGSHGKRAFTLP